MDSGAMPDRIVLYRRAILDELGWEWGGDWVHVADLHHLVWTGAPFGAKPPGSTAAAPSPR